MYLTLLFILLQLHFKHLWLLLLLNGRNSHQKIELNRSQHKIQLTRQENRQEEQKDLRDLLYKPARLLLLILMMTDMLEKSTKNALVYPKLIARAIS